MKGKGKLGEESPEMGQDRRGRLIEQSRLSRGAACSRDFANESMPFSASETLSARRFVLDDLTLILARIGEVTFDAGEDFVQPVGGIEQHLDQRA